MTEDPSKSELVPADSERVPKPRRSWRLGSDTDLYRHLENFDRGPIVAELARWLENGPSPEALAAMADERPDRWAAAMKHIAGLAGFVTDRTVNTSLSVTAIVDMSDSQLQVALAEKLAALGMSRELVERAAPKPDPLRANMAAAGLVDDADIIVDANNQELTGSKGGS